jgi:hypothetical protein
MNTIFNKKNLIYIIAILFIIASCKKQDLSYKGGNAFWFEGSTAQILESSSDSLIIKVIYTKNSPAVGSVSYSVAGGVLGVDYTISSPSTLVFSDSVYVQNIVIKPIDNSIASGQKLLLITLQNAVNGNLGLPGDSSYNKIFEVVITDDDCAYTIDDFANISYTVNETYSDGSSYSYNPISVGLSVVGIDTLVVENLGDWGGNDTYLKFNSDYTITVLRTPCNTPYLSFPTYWSGTGTFNPCTKVIVVNYDLVDEDGNSYNLPAINTFTP